MRRILIALVLAAVAGPARADDTTEVVETRAEQLFRQAKELMAADRYAEACPMLAESQGIDPGGGTLLTLAICYEKEGKLATAVATYRAAIAVAKTDGRADREGIAGGRIANLEPRLCRISARFALASLDLPGFSVTLDGAPLPPEHLAAGVAADEGKHRLRVVATGKRPFDKDIVVEGEAQRFEVIVPPLEDVPPEPRPAPKSTLRPRKRPHPRPRPASHSTVAPTAIAGWVVGAAGVAALGVGTYFGIRAVMDQSDANDICPDAECSDQNAIDLNDEAGTAADVATATLVVGGACVATGLFLLLAFDDEVETGMIDLRRFALRF